MRKGNEQDFFGMCILQVSLEVALIFTCLHFKWKGVYLITSAIWSILAQSKCQMENWMMFSLASALSIALQFFSGETVFCHCSVTRAAEEGQLVGLPAKISGWFLNEVLKVPPSFTLHHRCLCPRKQLACAWSIKHLLFILLLHLLRLSPTNPQCHVGDLNFCPLPATPALSVEQLIFVWQDLLGVTITFRS